MIFLPMQGENPFRADFFRKLHKMQILSWVRLWENLTIHLLWRSASGNVLTVALYAIEEKFDYSSPLAGCFRKCIDCCG
ncbi:hypothetical protein [Dapis sp. BLCC M126]|uniref:hypothetical protein n=1 Tax=Dapis sp. BLCC M126 TaxID=3400189 RepID=UPI003CEA1725